MSLSFCLLTALCLIIGIIFEQQPLNVSAFEFDHDVDPELCMTKWKEDENACLSNMWFICPLLCARVLNLGRGTMAQEKENPDKFYELHAKRLVVTENFDVDKGVDISLEDNEGYITLYAALPMLPGMAEYYHDAIEHIAQVYKYTLVVMIQPIYDSSKDLDENIPWSSASILESIARSRITSDSDDKEKTLKSILLTGYDIKQKPQNEVLEYLLTREVVAGVQNPDDSDDNLLSTRPNIFLVSHTGMYIERVVSPSMERIERRIKVHELGMEDFTGEL